MWYQYSIGDIHKGQHSQQFCIGSLPTDVHQFVIVARNDKVAIPLEDEQHSYHKINSNSKHLSRKYSLLNGLLNMDTQFSKMCLTTLYMTTQQAQRKKLIVTWHNLSRWRGWYFVNYINRLQLLEMLSLFFSLKKKGFMPYMLFYINYFVYNEFCVK